MKKVFVIVLVAATGFMLAGFRSHVVQPRNSNLAYGGVEIPEEVNTVLQNSCFGCHNSESRNEDAKEDLQFDKLDELASFALLGKLDDIRKEIEEEKMPPKRFLERYPDHALSKEDKELLLSWVDETSRKLKEE